MITILLKTESGWGMGDGRDQEGVGEGGGGLIFIFVKNPISTQLNSTQQKIDVFLLKCMHFSLRESVAFRRTNSSDILCSKLKSVS